MKKTIAILALIALAACSKQEPPQVVYQQPAPQVVVQSAPQPTQVVVQQVPQVDHTATALLAGALMGAAVANSNRDTYVPPPRRTTTNVTNITNVTNVTHAPAPVEPPKPVPVAKPEPIPTKVPDYRQAGTVTPQYTPGLALTKVADKPTTPPAPVPAPVKPEPLKFTIPPKPTTTTAVPPAMPALQMKKTPATLQMSKAPVVATAPAKPKVDYSYKTTSAKK